jgi:hypothetical protein
MTEVLDVLGVIGEVVVGIVLAILFKNWNPEI